jgi:hypothetical protein
MTKKERDKKLLEKLTVLCKITTEELEIWKSGSLSKEQIEAKIPDIINNINTMEEIAKEKITNDAIYGSLGRL